MAGGPATKFAPPQGLSKGEIYGALTKAYRRKVLAETRRPFGDPSHRWSYEIGVCELPLADGLRNPLGQFRGALFFIERRLDGVR